ncbi:putative zinc finger protein isoform E [Glycine soja]|uniref:Putative zinc finger protein isoform D n=2 Tax=Glycine subgen. Soja TaxID=1462606 RepID=A0A445ITE1_GLYSO|nr:putative zinc finger protein isoform D [Glycine soja]RZB89319.1 putative zinc finger protein isoform E [Glycine soja]
MMVTLSDETEELEPLFDYSRVQPLNPIDLDVLEFDSLIVIVVDDLDDYEDVICVDSKKRKISQAVGNEKTNGKRVTVVDIEDDDWLPPPPKIASNAQKTIDEDSTLKKLRLKKQELASFAESAKELLKDVEESSKLEIDNSLQSSVVGVDEKSTEHSERAKIVVSVQDKDGTKQIRMFMDDKFERIVKTYAEKIKCNLKQIVLSFDGDKISSSETPASLGMEDDDIIEVHVKSS